MFVNYVAPVLDAFQLAQDLEISLRVPSKRMFSSKTKEQFRRQFESSTKPNTSTTKELKGKSTIGELSRVLGVLNVLGVSEHFDHVVAQCPTRILLVERAINEDKYEEV